MSRSRAYRRHKRLVKLARRYRILRAVSIESDLCPRYMAFHLRCNCFDDPREHGRGRRTIEERNWQRVEDAVWEW